MSITTKNLAHLGVTLDRASFDRGDIDLHPLLSLLPDWQHFDSCLNNQAAERIGNAEVVITNKVVIDTDVIQRCPNLKLVMLAATGTDNVDLSACREAGIDVCNAKQYSTPAVVQHTIMMMLNLMTSALQYAADVQQGRWQNSPVFCLLDHPIQELSGKQLGIIGLGTLGSQVAKIAEAFGMHVAVCQRPGGVVDPKRMPFEQLVSSSDVISLHCPLNENTRGLLNANAFAMMKTNAIIINTARGAIIDTEALVTALRSGQIGGAGIDVLDKEPPDKHHPLLQRDVPNLLLTPHNAWGSQETRQRLISHLSDNLRNWQNGTPTNLVN